jgi:ATP-binding cassette subfamily C (CFTR/MRP) protein 1
LYGVIWVFWCGAFIYRFWELRKMMRVNPFVTRWHWAELGINGTIILLHLIEFAHGITKGSPAFSIWGAVFLSLAWAASLSTTYHEYRRGVKHSWPIVCWLVMAFVVQSLKVQALMWSVSRSSFVFVLSVLLFVLYGIVGIASFLYNVEPPAPIGKSVFMDIMDQSEAQNDDEKQVQLDSIDAPDDVVDSASKPDIPIVYGAYPSSPHSPEENSGLLGGMLYSWMNPLLELASRRPLEAPDLPKLSKVDETSLLCDRLEENWLAQVRTGNPSFFKALMKTFGPSFAFAGLFKVVNDGMVFVGPVVLSLLIKFIQNKDEPFWHGLMYAFAMGLASIIQSLVIHMYFFRVFRVGQQMRASIAALVYRKAFRMSFDSRKKYTVGEMVNHQSVDTSRLDGTMPYLHMIWSGPVQIIVSLALLYRIVGVSVFAGLLILLLMIPINIQISRMLSVIQKAMMAHKDARNKVINEVLQGIRVIKYFAWERSFEEKVAEVRQTEIDALQAGARIRAWTAFLWTASPVIVSLATFGVFTFLGHDLTPEIAFPALALINILRFPINALPNVISSIVDSQVSIARLQTYFLTYDLDITAVEQDLTENIAVKIEDGEFEWELYRPVLEAIDISVARGKLVAIVGEVGSGKSSILAALLGEIPKIRGRVVINGEIAYCPQQAWIQNTTVRNNITFGSEYEPGLYQEVIDVCELRSDLAILQAGDQTEIGEKGINLSGGQKQRVSLARAVYQQADIYLLDDPLSAVDAHVGKALFENCILRQLNGKTRILVTHQLQYMNKVDHIIVVSGGKVTEQGTYDQLMLDGAEFCKLIKAHVQDHHDDEQHEASKQDSDVSNEVSTATTPRIEESGEIELRLSALVSPNYGDSPSSSDVDQTYTTENLDGIPKEDDADDSMDLSSISSDTDNKKNKKDGEAPKEGKLMVAEERSVGSVDSAIYLSYAKAIGGFFITSAIILFFVLDSGSKIGSDWWLSKWAAAAELKPPPHSMKFYLGIYALIAVSNSVAILVRSFLLIYGAMRAAVTIHRDMLHAVMRSPVSWFDTVPLGRILNRFSKDQYAADESLMRTLSMALGTLFGVISIAIVVGAVTPWILVYVLPLAFLYRYIQQYYLNSSRELQRLSSISRSPIFALFGESLSGLSTIRGYGKVSEFISLNEEKIDENQKAHFLSTTANRWLGLRLEFVGTAVVFGAAIFAVVSRNSLAAGLVGLSITYALQLTSQLNWMVRMSTDVENELVAVERCVQYANLTPEAALIVEPRPPPTWPLEGSITFNNLSLRYREGLPLVLRGISCKIRGREKIGVVGRTGAGKSSLMNALFRITEAASGSISIDGINIASMGLEDLRSRLAIIPQDPTLFAGTVRSNLDPFRLYGDDSLWNALTAVYLREQVEAMPKGLDSPITEFGENLSVGSRQLMCLARALLRNPRILVMDEATASIDYKSDEKIQKTIREQFQNATVLTIAHRIATIADSDRVMVLDFGKIVEFDTPERLLQNPKSVYSQLAKKSMKAAAKEQEQAQKEHTS